METNIHNNPAIGPLVKDNLNNAVYIALLALVHIWHFTALGLGRIFVKPATRKSDRISVGNRRSVYKEYTR